MGLAPRTSNHPENQLSLDRWDKPFYKIGEVSRLVGVTPHGLRYWEKVFPHVSPRKSASNQRVYTRQTVQKLLLIKELLYEKKFTIEGARRALRRGGDAGDTDAAPTEQKERLGGQKGGEGAAGETAHITPAEGEPLRHQMASPDEAMETLQRENGELGQRCQRLEGLLERARKDLRITLHLVDDLKRLNGDSGGGDEGDNKDTPPDHNR